MVNFPQLVLALGQRAGSLVGILRPADLGMICSRRHPRCMGLPQELVDHIMNTLRDDLPTLKACSLVCKAMFASTRHLIHRTLRLTVRKNRSIVPRDFRGWIDNDSELRFVSYVGERGLLQYTRVVHLDMFCHFSPEILLFHRRHLRSLDQVRTLIIEHYDALFWLNHYNTLFANFRHAVTSLTLSRPVSHCQHVLQFIPQFPRLENLCLEWLKSEGWFQQGLTVPVVVDQPSLRGHLRLAGTVTVARLLVASTCQLSERINFRSVELEAFCGEDAQRILSVCAHTLEDLTIAPLRTGCAEFQGLTLAENTLLRRLTLRMPFSDVYISPPKPLLRALSTITSPSFREFVFELPHFDRPALHDWCGWEEIDMFLEERFTAHKYFKLVIRTIKYYDKETFEIQTKEIFPLLASKGRIDFETFHEVGGY